MKPTGRPGKMPETMLVDSLEKQCAPVLLPGCNLFATGKLVAPSARPAVKILVPLKSATTRTREVPVTNPAIQPY